MSLLARKTAHGSKLAVFYGYWAPAQQFKAERATLAAIPACYGPQQATLVQIVRDQQFSYPLPPGWQPTEQFNILGVQDGNRAGAYYFFLEEVPASPGTTSFQTLLQYLFSHLGINVTNTVYTLTAPPSNTVTGLELGVGTHRVHRDPPQRADPRDGAGERHDRFGPYERHDSPGYLRGEPVELAQRSADRDRGGIQHSFVQDLGQIAQASQQMQAFSQQVAGFDDALNSVDLITDPLTGKNYMASYNACEPGRPGRPRFLPR